MWAAVAGKQSTAPAPVDAPAPTAEERVAIVDANAIISGLRLEQLAERFCTIPEVLAEVRDKQARTFLSTLPFTLDAREPTDESLKAVQRFARETGDIHSLSAVDVKLLALAHTLELAANGGDNLREHPVQIRTRQKHKSRPRQLPGWGAGAVANPEDWKVVDEAPEDMVTNATGGQSRIIAAVQSLTLGADGGEERGDQPAALPLPVAPAAGTFGAAAIAAASSGTPSMVPPPPPQQPQQQEEGASGSGPSDGARAGVAAAGPSGSLGARLDEEDDDEDEDDESGWATVSKSRNADRRQQRKARRHQAWLESQQQAQQQQQQQGPGQAAASSQKPAGAAAAPSTSGQQRQGGASTSAAAAVRPPLGEEAAGGAGGAEEDEEEEGGEGESEEMEEHEGLELVTDDGGEDEEGGDDDGEGGEDGASEVGTASVAATTATAALTEVEEAEVLPNTTSNVFMVTADFAMQNVMLQMGLRLVTRDGKQITRVSRWALRCSACFFVTKEAGRVFCPRCGNMTMDKVEVTVGPGGAEFFGVRKKFILRGTKYSLPKPRGGRAATRNPILREDVMMARMGAYRRGSKPQPAGELDPFAPEFGSETWHQAGGGKKGQRGGIPPQVPLTSWKNNPNEVKATRKSRRK